jgi:hypothetical protein
MEGNKIWYVSLQLGCCQCQLSVKLTVIRTMVRPGQTVSVLAAKLRDIVTAKAYAQASSRREHAIS